MHDRAEQIAGTVVDARQGQHHRAPMPVPLPKGPARVHGAPGPLQVLQQRLPQSRVAVGRLDDELGLMSLARKQLQVADALGAL